MPLFGRTKNATRDHFKSRKGKEKNEPELLNLPCCDHPHPYSHLFNIYSEQKLEQEKNRKDVEALKEKPKEVRTKNDNSLHSRPSKFDTNYVAHHARGLNQEPSLEQMRMARENLVEDERDRKGSENHQHQSFDEKVRSASSDRFNLKESPRAQSLIEPRHQINGSRPAFVAGVDSDPSSQQRERYNDAVEASSSSSRRSSEAKALKPSRRSEDKVQEWLHRSAPYVVTSPDLSATERVPHAKKWQQDQNQAISPRSKVSPLADKRLSIQNISSRSPARPAYKSQASNYSSQSNVDAHQLLNALEDLASTIQETREEQKLIKSRKEKENKKNREKIEREIEKAIKEEVNRRLSTSSSNRAERVSTGVNTELMDYSEFYKSTSLGLENQRGGDENRRESKTTNTTSRSSTFSNRQSQLTGTSSILSSNSGLETFNHGFTKESGQNQQQRFLPSGLVGAESIKSGTTSKDSSPNSFKTFLDSPTGVILPLAASQSRVNTSNDSTQPQKIASQGTRNQLLARFHGLSSSSESTTTTKSPSTSDLGTVLFSNGLPIESLSQKLNHQEHSFEVFANEGRNNHLGLSLGAAEISPSRHSSEISWGSLGPPSDLGWTEHLKGDTKYNDRHVLTARDEFIQEQHRLLQLIQEEEKEKKVKALEILFGNSSDLSYGSLGTPTEFQSVVSKTIPSSPVDHKGSFCEKTPTVKSNTLKGEDLDDDEVHLNNLMKLNRAHSPMTTLLRGSAEESNPSEQIKPADTGSEISSFLLQDSEDQGEREWLQRMKNRSKERVEGWRGQVSKMDGKRKVFAEV